MSNSWRRMIAGDLRKKTRFHDFAGNLAPPSAWLYLPTCLLSTIRSKLAGRYTGGPWLGYRAVHRLTGLIQPDWKILEFGSGFSSLWFAQRCAQLWSIESDPTWYSAVRQMLEPYQHAHLLLQDPPFDRNAIGECKFDLALVDGLARGSAMEHALAMVRPGGFVYFDNSDVATLGDIEHARARELLTKVARTGSIEIFVDFSPGHLTVTQGMLGQL